MPDEYPGVGLLQWNKADRVCTFIELTSKPQVNKEIHNIKYCQVVAVTEGNIKCIERIQSNEEYYFRWGGQGRLLPRDK